MSVHRINREEEIELLRKAPIGMSILYGRRRVGKTALAQRAWEGAKYYLIDERNPTLDFEEIGIELVSGNDVIVDEFQRLGDEFLERLIRFYERTIHRGVRKGRLLLITSYMSVYRSLKRRPSFYQRFALELKLRPLRSIDVIKALGLDAYLLAGGTPFYIQTYSSLGLEGLKKKSSTEIELTLAGEVRSPKYAMILSYLYKPRKHEEIAKRIRVKNALRYLKVLKDLDLIRELRDPSKRYRFYEISDNAYRVFFREVEERILKEEAFEALIRDKDFLERYLGEKVEDVGYFRYKDVEHDALVWTRDAKYIVEAKYARLDDGEKNKIKRNVERRTPLKGRKAIVIDITSVEEKLKRSL